MTQPPDDRLVFRTKQERVAFFDWLEAEDKLGLAYAKLDEARSMYRGRFAAFWAGYFVVLTSILSATFTSEDGPSTTSEAISAVSFLIISMTGVATGLYFLGFGAQRDHKKYMVKISQQAVEQAEQESKKRELTMLKTQAVTLGYESSTHSTHSTEKLVRQFNLR